MSCRLPTHSPHRPRPSSYDAETRRALALTAIGHIGRSPMPNINTSVFLPPPSYPNNVNELDPTDVCEEYRCSVCAPSFPNHQHPYRYAFTSTTRTDTQTDTFTNTDTFTPSNTYTYTNFKRQRALPTPKRKLARRRHPLPRFDAPRKAARALLLRPLTAAPYPRIVPPVERPLRLPRRLTLETRPNALALRDRPRPQTRDLNVMSNSESARQAYVASIARIRGGPHRMYSTHPAPPYLDATHPRRRTSTVRPMHAQRDVEDAPALVARNANGAERRSVNTRARAESRAELPRERRPAAAVHACDLTDVPSADSGSSSNKPRMPGQPRAAHEHPECAQCGLARRARVSFSSLSAHPALSDYTRTYTATTDTRTYTTDTQTRTYMWTFTPTETDTRTYTDVCLRYADAHPVSHHANADDGRASSRPEPSEPGIFGHFHRTELRNLCVYLPHPLFGS
ncbi:hypothetical protein B0H15DRAFT_952589 [Mycena belliarum]|uniref:Uncharacterized protein n=1 Tax=Mycena belliarum TaxID=1033014 RepID=A0AAD6U271_9AGAR|nr:hypothetical protein B0H15DRAFT_952589 [Mycena belliae]